MSEDKKFVLPKILIGIPTYDAKNYCLDAFFENVFGFTYPKSNIEIFVADNSKTNKNALYIRDKFKVKTFWKDYNGCSVMEKLADSHNQIRRYFLESDCDYMCAHVCMNALLIVRLRVRVRVVCVSVFMHFVCVHLCMYS